MRRNARHFLSPPLRGHAPQGSHLRGNNDWGGLTRRAALLGLASAVTLGRASLALADAPTDRRFVVVNLRGALDGLSAIVPYGDAALTDLRGELVPPAPGEDGGMLDLGGFYGLHPALANLHAMYRTGEALAVHAVAGPYRARSHFEAQDFLEGGTDHRMTSGWLNRAAGAHPPPTAHGEAMAIGMSVPLLLRGPANVANWAPHGTATLDADLYARIAALNHDDSVLGSAIAEGLSARGFSAAVLSGDEPARNRNAFPALAKAAGEMLGTDNGPRIAAMEIGGWDTHAGQPQRLAGALRELDAGLAALKTGLGEAWRQTAVLTMTEFGRTVRMNGTRGTDHGTATVAFVLGGAVSGGRVVANWPGLGPGRLFEDRDLQPTLDLRSVAKGLLARHLGLGPSALDVAFPDSSTAEPMRDLIRAID
jgi:uncharacterized protein (DUF1501 family)